MYCTTCGKELPDGASVCDECGTRYSPEGRTIVSEPDSDAESGRRPYMDYRPFSGTDESGTSNQDTYGQNPYGQNSYGQNSYEQNAYWKEPYDESSGSGRTGFAIASLVLGIIAVCSCCLPIFTIPLGILAIIFAVLGLNSDNRGIAIAGLILGILALVFGLMMLVIGLLSSGSYYY